MPAPSQSFGTADSQNNARPDSAEPLPLFRPEAVLAQQQKFYGEIVLIRPLSLMLLSWFALGITAAVFGFLFLGHYTERAHVSGVIALSPAADSPAAKVLEASLFVPGRLIGRLHPGSQFILHCEACSTPFSQQTGTVLAIPNAPLGPAELSQINSSMSGPANKSQTNKNPAYKGLVYKIKVSLPPQAALVSQLNPSPQTGVKVEADIPLGRKPLIKWFFERSAS
jgi:hypothetical protein